MMIHPYKELGTKKAERNPLRLFKFQFRCPLSVVGYRLSVER